MTRRLALLAPVAAAGLTRVIQLLLLVVLLAVADGADQSTLVTGFALLSSFAIFTDSGASNYLLSLPRERLTRAVHTRATAVHVVLGSAGTVAALLVALLSAGASRSSTVVLVLVALGASQVFDSVTRTTRAPQLVHRKDARYALPDIVLVLAKGPLVLIAFLTGEPLVLCLLAVPSLIVVVSTYVANRRALEDAGAPPRRLLLAILEFGLSGSLSALYSQAPLVLGTAILGVPAVAPLAIAYRVVQPLEVVPATLSQQLIPRVRQLSRPFWQVWAAFFAVGLVFSVLLVVFRDVVLAVLGGESFDLAVFLVIAASMGPKFGNYALVAYSMGRGYVRQRLLATIVVGVVALTLTLIAALALDQVALAAVTVVCELVLAVVLSLLIRARSRKEDRP